MARPIWGSAALLLLVGVLGTASAADILIWEVYNAAGCSASDLAHVHSWSDLDVCNADGSGQYVMTSYDAATNEIVKTRYDDKDCETARPGPERKAQTECASVGNGRFEKYMLQADDGTRVKIVNYDSADCTGAPALSTLLEPVGCPPWDQFVNENRDANKVSVHGHFLVKEHFVQATQDCTGEPVGLPGWHMCQSGCQSTSGGKSVMTDCGSLVTDPPPATVTATKNTGWLVQKDYSAAGCGTGDMVAEKWLYSIEGCVDVGNGRWAEWTVGDKWSEAKVFSDSTCTTETTADIGRAVLLLPMGSCYEQVARSGLDAWWSTYEIKAPPTFQTFTVNYFAGNAECSGTPTMANLPVRLGCTQKSGFVNGQWELRSESYSIRDGFVIAEEFSTDGACSSAGEDGADRIDVRLYKCGVCSTDGRGNSIHADCGDAPGAAEPARKAVKTSHDSNDDCTSDAKIQRREVLQTTGCMAEGSGSKAWTCSYSVVVQARFSDDNCTQYQSVSKEPYGVCGPSHAFEKQFCEAMGTFVGSSVYNGNTCQGNPTRMDLWGDLGCTKKSQFSNGAWEKRSRKVEVFDSFVVKSEYEGSDDCSTSTNDIHYQTYLCSAGCQTDHMDSRMVDCSHFLASTKIVPETITSAADMSGKYGHRKDFRAAGCGAADLVAESWVALGECDDYRGKPGKWVCGESFLEFEVYTDENCTTRDYSMYSRSGMVKVRDTCTEQITEHKGKGFWWSTFTCEAKPAAATPTELAYMYWDGAAATCSGAATAEGETPLGCTGGGRPDYSSGGDPTWTLQSTERKVVDGEYVEEDFASLDCSGTGTSTRKVACGACSTWADSGKLIVECGGEGVDASGAARAAWALAPAAAALVAGTTLL